VSEQVRTGNGPSIEPRCAPGEFTPLQILAVVRHGWDVGWRWIESTSRGEVKWVTRRMVIDRNGSNGFTLVVAPVKIEILCVNDIELDD